MPNPVPLVVATIILAGLAIFQFRYQHARARFAGLSAFAMGLAAIGAFATVHATVGAEGRVAATAFYRIHLMMCAVEVLLLAAVLGLRDPWLAAYHKFETALLWILAAAAVTAVGIVAWYRPQRQDEVLRAIVVAGPWFIAIAILARFPMSRLGLFGAAVFVLQGASNLAYYLVTHHPAQADFSIVLQVAGITQLLSYVGILAFFYLAANEPQLQRSPWGCGSLDFNPARAISLAILLLSLIISGYLYYAALDPSLSSTWTVNDRLTFSAISASAFAGCMLATVGLATGRSRIAALR